MIKGDTVTVNYLKLLPSLIFVLSTGFVWGYIVFLLWAQTFITLAGINQFPLDFILVLWIGCMILYDVQLTIKIVALSSH